MTSITTSLKNFDAELLFTDTDSLTYAIKSEDVYEEFFKHKYWFDFSNYPKDSKFFEETNKKVINKMKDESKRKIAGEFIGLKSKMHSVKKIDRKESSTTKGVNIATKFNDFKDTLFNKKIVRLMFLKTLFNTKIVRHKMRRIQCKKHKLGPYEINKISLLCFDDKGFVLEDGIHMLPYFHKDIDSHK